MELDTGPYFVPVESSPHSTFILSNFHFFEEKGKVMGPTSSLCMPPFTFQAIIEA
jgi:hypothetical protein